MRLTVSIDMAVIQARTINSRSSSAKWHWNATGAAGDRPWYFDGECRWVAPSQSLYLISNELRRAPKTYFFFFPIAKLAHEVPKSVPVSTTQSTAHALRATTAGEQLQSSTSRTTSTPSTNAIRLYPQGRPRPMQLLQMPNVRLTAQSA